jgi:hypothetical protein
MLKSLIITGCKGISNSAFAGRFAKTCGEIDEKN